jgi:hypothetical protein
MGEHENPGVEKRRKPLCPKHKIGILIPVEPLIIRTFADLINLLLTTRFPPEI